MAGLSFQSFSTIGHLKGMIISSTNTWRLCAGYRSRSASALPRRTRHFIRPSNGHSSPGIKCPESLYMRIRVMTIPGAPCYFLPGNQWEIIP
eukprot:3597768-Pyramimonas_sp.AAC.1